ncbi:MAG: hypothetical protein D6820_15210, partial [Lentisphaerae bacterium]
MKDEAKSKGPWIHRFVIRILTLVLAVLIYWILGFFVDDIRSIPGPDYSTIEKKFIDKASIAKQQDVEKQIEDLTRQIENLREKQRIVRDSSRNLQETINQLIELRKLGIQKSIDFSAQEQATFASSLK